MYTLLQTPEFSAWLAALKDHVGKARINKRLDQASISHFGDCKQLGKGVAEMRIDVGPGYRVYFARQGTVVYIILLGGDKDSQERDTVRAKAMWKGLKHEKD